MLEKRFRAIPAQLFAANGTAAGIVTVPDTSLFKVKQQVIVVATSLPNLDQLEIKDIFSPTQMIVGPRTGAINTFTDLSAYTTALGANVFANEQRRPIVPSDDFERACYEEEPTVAKRVVMVDKYGNKYDDGNPLPVDATVNVVVPPITVDIDALTPPNKADPDSVLIVGSEDGTKTGLKHAFVNNMRLQILATQDRDTQYTYVDFGTKNQRITRIDYSSSTIPGYIVRRDFSYVPDGNKYRRTTESWSVV